MLVKDRSTEVWTPKSTVDTLSFHNIRSDIASIDHWDMILHVMIYILEYNAYFEVQWSTSASLEHPTTFPAFGTIWRQQPSEGNNLPRPCWAFAGLAYVDELSAEDQFATSQPLEVEQFLILCVLVVMVYLFVDRRYLSIEALLQGPSLADFVMASCFTYTLRWAQNGMKGDTVHHLYTAILSMETCSALPPQTTGRPGKNSPWRDRPKSESLDLEWFPATNLKLYCMSLTALPEVLDKMLRVWLCKMKGGRFIENWFWIFSHFSEGVAFYKEYFGWSLKGSSCYKIDRYEALGWERNTGVYCLPRRGIPCHKDVQQVMGFALLIRIFCFVAPFLLRISTWFMHVIVSFI